MQLLSLGSDPEFFLVDREGKVQVSQGVVPGTKDRPKQLRYGAVHRDNVLCELNPLPATCEEEFSNNTLALMDEVTARILRPKGLSLLTKASHEFEWEQLESKEARTFGCLRDEGIWERMQSPIDHSMCGNARGAGGHIHLGIEGLTNSSLVTVISALDLLISVPLVLVDPDKIRRKFYGQAGKFRVKPYGIEYRTPSNAWCTSDNLRRWVYRQVQRAVDYPVSLLPETQQMMVSCVDNSDVGRAEYLIDMFGLEVPS